VLVVHLDMSNTGLKLIEPQEAASATTINMANNIPFNLIPLPDND
jgi:hypothetical protein